jgi:hypothetical protein
MNLVKSALWIGLLSSVFAVVAVAADSNLRVMDLTEQIEVIFSKSTMDQALAHLKTLPYLSYWLLVVSFMSLFGTLQAFYSTALLKQFQFNLKQQEVTPLAGRLFGCWTTLATLIRVCCALEPSNVTVYRLTIATFILAISLFIHAVIIARAMSFRNAMMPMVFALPSFVWMVFFPPYGRI